MTRIFILFQFIGLLLSFSGSNAQTNTIYFDKIGKACAKESAYYYRSQMSGDNYQSAYVNGDAKFFEGNIKEADNNDENNNIYHGVCKWYYKNGNLKSERSFNDAGKEDGVSLYYYDNGKLEKRITFKNGVIENNKYLEIGENGANSYIFTENFTNNFNDWDLYDSEKSKSVIDNNALTLTSKSKEGSSRYIRIPIETEDYSIEAKLENTNKKMNFQSGLIFNFKDWNNYYYFLIDKGNFYIGLVYEGVKASKIDQMFTTSISSTGTNLLKILSTDDKVFFSINGEIQYTCTRFEVFGNNIGLIINGKGETKMQNLIVKELNADNKSETPLNNNKEDKSFKASGTGFFISKNGYIATNYHVVNDAKTIVVELTSGNEKKSYYANVITSDKDNDLAIVKITDESFRLQGELEYSFKENGIVELGTAIFTLGYPYALSGMGKDIKFTDGKISAKTGYNGSISSYQTTVPVQPGNSGGPLFNDKGELIGIINSKFKTADNASYAIKVNYLKNLIELLPESIELKTTNNIAALSVDEKVKKLTQSVVLIKLK